MESLSLGCQVCLTKFGRVFEIKKHMHSTMHRKKMEEIFQKDKFQNFDFPSITLMNSHGKYGHKQPMIGLSLLTLCFSPEAQTNFYLCHVCEEKCSPKSIVGHLLSGDHCSNYFTYTDPNVLSFSWIPRMDMRGFLRHEVAKEINKKGTRQLQMLDLPEDLLKKHETSTYAEVIRSLSENDKLLKLLKAVEPKRTMLQTYQRDGNRKHPLLGMQHLVECICVGPAEKRHYLCTLCSLTFVSHMIIKHVLSFDHIFCYFKAWHPCTLLSKESYSDYSTFASMILDLAKQTEKIHGTANTDMKQVRLEPDEYASVNFNYYTEALEKLESIRKKNSESCLITVVTPGNKLECPVPASPVRLSLHIRCQDCNLIIYTISNFGKHVKSFQHQQMLKKFFGKAQRVGGFIQTGQLPHLTFYSYLKDCLTNNKPAIGVSLVLTCVSTELHAEPIYVCFACSDSFPESSVKQHCNSQKHLIHTLLYLNPWRLPVAWETFLDVKDLRLAAWEEEQERGQNQTIMKVIDLPSSMFEDLIPPSHPKVMKRLEKYYTLLKRDVPPCETHSRHQDKERFPLLGKQFLVMHDICFKQHQPTKVAFLCLLCERRLSDDECYTHVFSREHIKTFIDRFHPGSLNSNTDAETLLNLAKQAQSFHDYSNVQEINLERPIWEPCSYSKAIVILSSAKKRCGQGYLIPQIVPKKKLVPRVTLKDPNQDHMKDNSPEKSKKLEDSEKKTSEKPTDHCEKTKVGAVITKTQCAEDNTRSRTPSEKESLKTITEEIKSAGINTCQETKEEKTEEPTVRLASEETMESCMDLKSETKEQSHRNILTHLKTDTCKEEESKRPVSMSEESQDICHNDHKGKEISCEREQLTSKQKALCREAQSLPSSRQREETTTVEGDSNRTSQGKDKESKYQQADKLWQYLKRTSREPVIGLSALFECHCDQRSPIYLCECCSVKIPENDIVSHVTGSSHQNMYLLGFDQLPRPPGSQQGNKIRTYAVLVEKQRGYGGAQVVDLDEEVYDNVLKQNFESALKTVKALQAQQDSVCESPSASALSSAQPVDTLFTPHAQNERSTLLDDYKVMDMEIEEILSLETVSMSVETENSSKTADDPPDSSEDVKMTHTKQSESAHNANTCQTVTRSSESCLHQSISVKNTTPLHPASTGNHSKAEFISKTTLGGIKEETTSKLVGGSSQCADTSNAVVTTCSKPMRAINDLTARSFSSAKDTTKVTAPVSKLNANTACFNTATSSKSGDSAFKFVTATTTQSTTANPNTKTTTTTSVRPTKSGTPSATIGRTPSATIGGSPSATIGRTPSATFGGNPSATFGGNPSATFGGTPNMSVASNAEVAPKNHKSSVPAAPHLSTHMSKNRNLPTEPPHISTSEIRHPKVGIKYLIEVSCEKKKQFYCLLCSAKLRRHQHLMSFRHKFNYVKLKLPGWTAEQSEMMSELNKKVAQIAEAEKSEGTCSSKRIKVNMDVYNELHRLQEDEALRRVKAMIGQKDSGVSSSTPDTAEVWTPEAGFMSPCEAPSPDDEMYLLQNGTIRLSPNIRSEQNKHVLQRPAVQIPEVESISNEDRNPAAGQSERDQSSKSSKSSKSSEREAKVLISDQISCPILNKNEPRPMSKAGIQDANNAVKKPLGGAAPLTMQSESSGLFAQSSDAPQETPEKRHQQGMRDLKSKVSQKVLKGSEKTSPAANTDPQNQPRPTHRCENAPQLGSSTGPEHHSASHALPTIVIGEKTTESSFLSTLLRVKQLNSTSIIGLDSVWECQGIPKNTSNKTFFLCESCRERLSLRNIFRHLISDQHLLNHMKKRYLQFMMFWEDKELLPEMKMELLKDIARMLSCREKDAQTALLEQNLFEYVQTAPFSEALKILQNLKKEQKRSILCPPISTQRQNDQRPEEKQNPAESLHTETSAQAQETDRSEDNERRQNPEKQPLDWAKQGKDLSSPAETSVYSKDDALVAPVLDTGTSQSPQETCRNQSEVLPPVSEYQRPITEVPVEQVRTESPSSSVVGQKTSQTLAVSSEDKSLRTRKRPAVDMLASSCTSNPQLEDPLPAKSMRRSLQPSTESASESISVHPAATWPFPSAEDRETQTEPEQPDKLIALIHLIAVEREKRSDKFSPRVVAPGDSETSTSCANASSTAVVESKHDPEFEQTRSTMVEKQTRWDSKVPLIKDTGSAVLQSATTADHDDPQRQRSVDAQSRKENMSQIKPRPNCEATTHNPGPTSQLGANTELPINPIITERPDPADKPFKSHYKTQGTQGSTKVNRGTRAADRFSSVVSATCSDAPEGYGHSSQIAYVTNGHSDYHSSEAVQGYTTPVITPVNTLYAASGIYPSHIITEPEANNLSLQPLGRDSVTPMAPRWASQDLQLVIQQQQQTHQQVIQQQYTSWTGAAGDNRGVYETTYVGAVPLATPANNSQGFNNLNENGTTVIHIPQVPPRPVTINFPPTANSANITQPSNYIFYLRPMVSRVAPSVVNDTPPVLHQSFSSNM